MPKPVAEVGEGKLIYRWPRQFFLGLLSIVWILCQPQRKILPSLFQFGQLEWCNAFRKSHSIYVNKTK